MYQEVLIYGEKFCNELGFLIDPLESFLIIFIQLFSWFFIW